MDLTTLLITVAIVGLVLYRQFSGQFVRSGNRDVVLPVVIIGLGLLTIATGHPAVTGAGLALLAVELVLVAALGAIRGYAFRLEIRDGALYRRGSLALLVVWVLTIVVRIGAGALGDAAGAGALISTTSAIVFGGSLLVQGFVLRKRIAESGAPLRPSRFRRAARTGLA